MTREDAITITNMVLNRWAKPSWTDGQTEAYVNALIPYDADLMTSAVALAHKTLQFRPPFSELYQCYRAAKAEAASRQEPPPVTASGKRNTLPFWVKRWVCARYLYTQFGKERDLRIFPEQGDWAGPGERMPPDAWVNEANRITERDAVRAVAP